MPTLVIPPRVARPAEPSTSARPASASTAARTAVPALELPSVAFFGRTLAEYARFFALEPLKLRGRAVLDVAAGPSSFTAEACRLRVDSVAVDPLYGCKPETLATHVELDYRRMQAQMRANPGLFRTAAGDPASPVYFASLDEADRDRRTAAARFLDDYAAHFAHGRYFGAALPHLPFFDRQFDLVLCAHLLFVYAARFDFVFHVAACRELVRVSRDEVRIHPVCGLDGRPYAGLTRLRRELKEHGIVASVVPVNYEFFVGGDSMLVLKRA
ncbi:MAG TPA: methyltransferase [Opitutaceae bacterium]